MCCHEPVGATIPGVARIRRIHMILLFLAWYIIMFIQLFLGYGTAYRLTKTGGNNGIALFGWMFVMGLVAIIPGLGFYMWKKYRNIG